MESVYITVFVMFTISFLLIVKVKFKKNQKNTFHDELFIPYICLTDDM